MPWTDSTIVMGFYLGIGDFLSAVPVVNELLRNGNRVVMVASPPNVQLAEIIRFESRQVRLVEFAPFSTSAWRALKLFNQLRRLQPDRYVISPHARRDVSSWKLPILLWTVKHLSRPQPLVVGSDDEKLSQLYDVRLPVNKDLGLIAREWSLHMMAGSLDEDAVPNLDIFNRSAVRMDGNPKYDLVVHPGASRDVKMWPVDYHRELIGRLDDRLRIAYVGTESELATLKMAMNDRDNIEFFVGSIVEAVSVVAKASVVLTMDSGFSHVAALLGVRHFALFGSTDPTIYPPPSDQSTVLYKKALPCQPCNQHRCHLSHTACMRLVKPSEVAVAIWDALNVADVVKSV